MRNRLNKIVAAGLVLALASNATAQAVTKIDKFASGSDIAITGERWFPDIYKRGNANAEISNKNKVINPEGYAELSDVVLDLTSWNDWAQVSIGLEAKNNGVSYDLAQCSGGFRYKYMGSEHRFYLIEKDNLGNHDISFFKEVSNIDGYFDWQQVIVEISSITRNTYDPEYLAGNTDIPLNLSRVKEFQWTLQPGGLTTPDAHAFTGYLKMKDFECLGTLDLSKVTPIRLSQTTINNIRVKAIGNSILLSNLPQGATVELYNLQGKLIFTSGKSLNRENRGSDNLVIPVQTKGMYIIRIGINNVMRVQVM